MHAASLNPVRQILTGPALCIMLRHSVLYSSVLYNWFMLQDDSSDTETSSSEHESSSEDDEEEPSPSSSLVIKSDLFVTGNLATLWK